MKSNRIWWVLIILAAILVYFPALNTFFSQDDFTHLFLSKFNNFREFLLFFKPVETGIYYRPLSIQIYTALSNKIFGLNPFGFHAIALGVHLVNIYLVFQLLNRFVKSKTLCFIGAFVYGVHASHFMSLFWIAEFSMVLAPMFAFLSMLAFFDKRYWRFLMFITLGMLSNELVASVPLILLFISIFEKTKLKIKYLLAGLIVATLFLLLRFVWFPTSLGSEYLLSFSPLVWLKNLKWYVFRAFGLAEGFRGHIDMWQIQVSLIALVGVALAFARRLRISSIFLLGIGWFIVAIMPVMLLSHHQSPIYQIIGLPGMIIALLSLLPKKLVLNWKVAGVMFLYFVSSLLSVRAMQEYHWVTKRARLARYHLNKLKMHRVEQDSVVSFINSTPKSSTHVYFSLGGENGVKVFFDKSVKALFEDFDSVSLSPETIYIFSHKEI